MSPPQTLATIALPALFTQAALYGLYVATLIHCLRWLVFTDEGWKQRDKVNKLTLITAILIFVCSTVNLVLSFSNQSDLMGEPWGSNILIMGTIQVCEYHGRHLGQKMSCIHLFPGSDRGGPDSNRRCSYGLSLFVRLKRLR